MEALDPEAYRRKALKTAVSALCFEVGFCEAEDAALETLCEMLQSYLLELGRSTQAYCELACRTEPMLSDVVMALVEMGMNVRSLAQYSRRTNKTVLTPSSQSTPPPTPRILQIGEKKKHSSHIPDYLPAFPDPHTYIKSDTHKEPESEYQIVREKAATQKRDVERALTRFIAKTGETESLFSDDPYAYPLIANKPKPLPYIDCLMPKEEDLAMQGKEGSIEQPQVENTQKEETPSDPSRPTESVTAIDTQGSLNTSKSQSQESGGSGTAGSSGSGSVNTGTGGGSGVEAMDTDSQIDNPYLREIKMPKLKGAGKKSTSIQAMSSSTKWSF